MENKGNESTQAATSFIPIFIMAAALMILMQYWGEDPYKGIANPSETSPLVVPEESEDLPDFQFETGSNRDGFIDTGNYYVVLKDEGGRIDRFYLKSREDLIIPQSVLDESGDPLSREEHALEVTRGNGMDFQPHLYNRDSSGLRVKQIADPPLNRALFRTPGPVKDSATGIQQVRFETPVTFKGHRLEIAKMFRFFPNENFFRQTTAIRNLEEKEFRLGGALFYKPFGDTGPEPAEGGRDAYYYERFFYYNDDMEQSANVTGGGSFGFFCGGGENPGLFTHYLNAPHSLEFVGSSSRYFFSYAKFLSTPDFRNRPDGILNVNKIDPAGREAFTAVYNDLVLAPSSGEDLDLGDTAGKNYERVLRTSGRADALVVDSQVFFGVRRDESHFFYNQALALSEFGSSESDDRARRIISSFALFSKLKDAIVWAMHHVYNLTGNYGWTIIIIASLFKLLTFPLNQMQAKSMKRMSILKPEMERINEKYADNPQEKQKKVMELYKKHNINPAKGCLPLLIQMPVFIALYSAFSESIELWNSPFVLWMTDLSSPDTIYVLNFLFIQDFNLNILPLLMVGSQILQQKLTTATMDPQQQTMMYMMPFIMLFFFWSMPSGVTLYWTVQNMLAIVWQLVAEKFMDNEEEAS